MQEKPNYYAILPAEVRYDQNISSLAKLLYAEITALTQKEGFAWATNTYFATLYNVSSHTISGIVSDLIKAGYIQVEIDKSKGNIRKIYLLSLHNPIPKNKYPMDKNVNRYGQKRPYPMDKNVYTPSSNQQIESQHKKIRIIQENNINNNGAAFASPPGAAHSAPENHRGEYSPAKERIRQAIADKSLRSLSKGIM